MHKWTIADIHSIKFIVRMVTSYSSKHCYTNCRKFTENSIENSIENSTILTDIKMFYKWFLSPCTFKYWINNLIFALFTYILEAKFKCVTHFTIVGVFFLLFVCHFIYCSVCLLCMKLPSIGFIIYTKYIY